MTLWDDFFKQNPFFGQIETKKILKAGNQQKSHLDIDSDIENKIIAIQRFWRKRTSSDTLIAIQPKSVHMSQQAQLMANVKSDQEIKDIFISAAKTGKFNTNTVQGILPQKNALKCAYELFKEKIINEKQFLRIAELHKQHVRQEHIIYKSLNTEKIKRLLKFLHNGLSNISDGVKDDPFKEIKEFMGDPQFPEIVFGLFTSQYSEGLQTQQLLTLLELYQAIQRRVYQNNKRNEIESVQPVLTRMYRILDDREEFTEEAKKYLLPTLDRGVTKWGSVYMKPVKDDESYSQFKALVSQLPLSEQIFYILAFQNVRKYGDPPNLTLNVVGEKAMFDIENDMELSKKDGKYHGTPFIIPTCGIRNTIGILRYGVENYIPVIPQFGIKSMSDIEKGLKVHRGRLAYLYYPNTSDPGAIHGSPKDPYIGVFAHDVYHSDIVSSIPEYARKGLLKFVDIIREKTSFEWSDEMWVWVDADFRYFKTKDYDDSVNPIVHFCSMLDTVQLPSGMTSYGHIIRHHKGITPVGIMVMIDMVKNKKEWKKAGLDPDVLPDASHERVPLNWRTNRGMHQPLDYKKYYTFIEEIIGLYPDIRDKAVESQLLEMMVYLTQQTMPSKEEMEDFGRFVNQLQELNLLAVEKNKYNRLILRLNGHAIIYDEGNGHPQLQAVLLLYKGYVSSDKTEWQNEDFIKAYTEAEGIIKQFTDILEDKTESKALEMLKNIIRAITQNTSLEGIEQDINKLKPSIESYSDRSIRLFKSADESLKNEKSDILLNLILKKAYLFDKKSLINFVDLISNYYDVLSEEKKAAALHSSKRI